MGSGRNAVFQAELCDLVVPQKGHSWLPETTELPRVSEDAELWWWDAMLCLQLPA